MSLPEHLRLCEQGGQDYMSADGKTPLIVTDEFSHEVMFRYNSHKLLLGALERAFLSLGKIGGNNTAPLTGDVIIRARPEIRKAWLEARSALDDVKVLQEVTQTKQDEPQKGETA